jgi:hypothetical protein
MPYAAMLRRGKFHLLESACQRIQNRKEGG